MNDFLGVAFQTIPTFESFDKRLRETSLFAISNAGMGCCEISERRKRMILYWEESKRLLPPLLDW